MLKIEVASTEEQLKSAFHIRMQVFVEEQQVPMELEVDEHEAESIHFILYDGELPIGTGRLRSIYPFVKVERFCILAPHRRRGYGRHLMEAMEQYAIQHNMTQLKLHAQTHAESFYTQLGYQTTSDLFLEADMPHVVMEKTIGR